MILRDGRWYVADPLNYRQFEEMMFRATVIMRQQFADSCPRQIAKRRQVEALQ